MKRERRPEPEPQPLPADDIATVYHYQTKDGDPFLAVVRRPKAPKVPGGKPGKEITQWTPKGDGWIPRGPRKKRPLYRLPKLLADTRDRCVIVEGEKCVAALQEWCNSDEVPDAFVTTWAGGSAAWKHTDWKPLKGKSVSILADANKPGLEAAYGIAGALHKIGMQDLRLLACDGETVASVYRDLELAPPDDPDDTDIADWIDDKVAGKIIADFLKPYEPWPDLLSEEAAAEAGAADTATDEEGAALLNLDLLESNEYFSVYGLEGERMAVWVRTMGQLLKPTREMCCQVNTLISFAPLSWWQSQQFRGENLTVVNARRAGDAIIRIGDRRGQTDETLIYEAGPVRTPDGDRIWHLGDRLMREDGEEAGLDEGPGIFLSSPAIVVGDSASVKERDQLRQRVEDYPGWSSEIDAQRFMAWIASSIIGGMLTWRPHLLFIAPSGSGKSWWLDHVTTAIIGPLGEKLVQASTAGMGRLTARHRRPMVVDEAEVSQQWVRELFPLARRATGESGARVVASLTDQDRVVRQTPRFSLMLAAIDMPALEPADANRFSVAHLNGRVDKQQGKAILAAMPKPERFRSALIRESWAFARHVEELTTLFSDSDAYAHLDARAADNAAVFTAGWMWWQGSSMVLPSVVSSSDDDDDGPSSRAVHELLALTLRISGEDMSVVQMLTSSTYRERASESLGIRRDDSNAEDGLMVACTHVGLRKALKKTSLADKSLRAILLQIPGSGQREHPQSFGRNVSSIPGRRAAGPRAGGHRDRVARETPYPGRERLMRRLKDDQRVTYEEARKRALVLLADRKEWPASMVADAIWPGHNMTGQGAGGAGSRVLRRMEKEGLVWRSTWGWRKT